MEVDYLKFFEDFDLPVPSSDEEVAELLEDEDTVNDYEREQSFKVKYQIADESAVTLKKDYVLSLCHDGSFTRIAAGLSNAEVQIFDVSAERGLCHSIVDCILAPPAPIKATEKVNVCGVRFLDETGNSLLVGSTNGLVRLFDLRTEKEEARFEVDIATCVSGVTDKTITCFDRNANGRILCAGTEEILGNVFLLFFDVRERKQMGGYNECHSDDVTSVLFHSLNPDSLCSGSTDGLINVFDIKETCEDDALQNTINTENSVLRLNWHKNVDNKDIISCITQSNDFMVYESEDGNKVADFERKKITAAAKRKNPANFNVVGTHNMADGSIFLLAGTNYKKGEVLRSLHLQNQQLLPLAEFAGNKQIVRESIFDAKTNAIATGGECGIVTVWTPRTTEETVNTASSQLKSKSKSLTQKKTPY